MLLTLEVALSLMLAIGAGLLGYSLVKLHRTPLGFEPHGLVFLMPEGKAPVLEQKLLLQKYHNVIENIQSLADVQAASISAVVPLNGAYINDQLCAPGGPAYHFQENSVGPLYFKTLATPLLAGREFLWSDVDGSGLKVILNLSAARLLFPDGRILGHRVIFNDSKKQAEVIGVVADSKYSDIRAAAPPTVYSAAMQSLIPGASLDIVIRTKGAVAPLIAAVRNIVKRAIPEVPLPAAMNMEETVADSLATERVMSTLALFFGGVSVLITGIGLYGTLAYSTGRRTGEIGIRLALGARRVDVLTLVLAENGAIVILGCLLGLAASLFASKTIASFLYGVSAHNAAVFFLSAGMLLCIGVLASLLPARRAASIDPLSAIRYE